MAASRFSSGASTLESQAKSGGRSFARADYFSLDDGESVTLRFLTDSEYDPAHPWTGAWLSIPQHSMVNTKAAPSDWQGDNWPTRMGAVCRHIKTKAGESLYDSCVICDELKRDNGKPYTSSVRGWALACLREEVREDGMIVGFRDQTKKFTDESGERQVPAIVLMNNGWKNCFSRVKSFGGYYGTMVDRDYRITRTGKSLDTVYDAVAMDPIYHHDLRLPWAFAEYCPGVDPQAIRSLLFPEGVEDPTDARSLAAVLAKLPPAGSDAIEALGDKLKLEFDMDVMVEERCSEDFYGRFFDPHVDWHPKSKGDDAQAPAGASESPQPAAPSADVSKSELTDLAARIKQYSEPATS